jgi:predicted metal-dependent hydrolase
MKTAELSSFSIGDLQFAMRRSSQRKSMSIVIERDGTLSLLVPAAANDQQLSKFVREKRMWIYRKLSERDLLARQTVGKEFVTGEGFSYLGRTYRLLLVDQQDRPLKLVAGRFHLRRSDQCRARAHFISWYTEHAEPWLLSRVTHWANRMSIAPGPVVIQDLGNRWGSCGKRNRLNFHWVVMTLPVHAVDYLIVHELTHIVVPSHNKQFWQRLARTMSDFECRKAWLASNGARFSSL